MTELRRHLTFAAEEIQRSAGGAIAAERGKVAELRMKGAISPKEARKRERELDRLTNALLHEEKQKSFAKMQADRRRLAIKARREQAIGIQGTIEPPRTAGRPLPPDSR